MDRIPRPNFRLYLADGNPTRLWESVVSTLQTGRTTPVALYEAGRGCQHDCDFCSVIHFFGPLRYKDPEVVHDDILYGIEELGLYDYFFTDDNLGGNPRRFRELVGWLLKIKRKHPSFIWSGQFSFANIAGHEEDIARAAESGLATCFLGLETPRPELFEKVKKHNTLNIVKTGLAILKEHHILASCNLVLGLPTDTVGFASYMMEGLRSLDVPTIAPFTCAYLPGTRLFNDLYQEGDEDLAEMVRSGWKYNNSIDVIAGTDTLTRGELYEERQEFFRQYYSYARMVDTACSFYSRVAVWKHPLQWLKGPSGLYLAVLLYNVLGYRAIHSHTHHMAGGTYSIDAEMLMRLIKDSAVRMETGFEGLLYASAANVLCRCSGALNRYLKTRGGARSMANGSKAAS